MADVYPQPIIAKLAIRGVERHQLRTPERAGEAKQEEGAVATTFEVGFGFCHHRKDLVGGGRCLADGALPVERRMPRSITLTASEFVGGSWPASLYEDAKIKPQHAKTALRQILFKHGLLPEFPYRGSP